MNTYNLSDKVFRMFQDLVYREIGIHLSHHKHALVQTRLRKWLVKYELDSYEDLYKLIEKDTSDTMIIMLINSITTNVTSFFREEKQWVYFLANMQTIFNQKTKQIRIWSAACSSGEEPYSIIIFLKEHLKEFHKWDIKILATDISQNALRKAQYGIYKEKEIENMPKHLKQKYFKMQVTDENFKTYHIKEELKKYITFRTFNLVKDDYSIFKNKFDIVFCRNVMIYFDRQTQENLLRQFFPLLKVESRLFIGHSESIHNKDLHYKLSAPAIYQIY